MKKLLLLMLTCIATSPLFAQGADQMKAWQDYMTPGDVHRMLAKSDGLWNVETTMWMDAGSEPMKSKGTCTNTMLMGGRYQQSDFKSEMMGQPFEGRSLLGYDNAKHSFISTWIDNMGTGVMVIEGKWDEATKSIHYTGTMTDPISGKDMPIRETFTIKDDNHHMMEMWVQGPDGKEMKSMEILFTRAGKKG